MRIIFLQKYDDYLDLLKLIFKEIDPTVPIETTSLPDEALRLAGSGKVLLITGYVLASNMHGGDVATQVKRRNREANVFLYSSIAAELPACRLRPFDGIIPKKVDSEMVMAHFVNEAAKVNDLRLLQSAFPMIRFNTHESGEYGVCP